MKNADTEQKYWRRVAKAERAIGKMARRWPRIAEDARHPICAASVAMKMRLSWTIKNAILTILGIALAIPLILVAGIFGVLLVFLVGGWLRALMDRQSPSPQFARMLNAPDPSRMEAIWLSPLHFREMAATEALRAYVGNRWANRIVAVVIVALGAALLWWPLIAFMGISNVDTWIWGCAGVFAMSPLILLADDSAVNGSIRRIHQNLRRETLRRRPMDSEKLRRGVARVMKYVLLIFAIALAVMSVTIIVISMAEWIESFPPEAVLRFFQGLLFLSGCVFLLYAVLWQKALTEKLYRSAIEKGQPLYEELALEVAAKNSQ